jgi:hypothetical protein
MEQQKQDQPAPEELMEKLSAIEHERWADWQRYVFSKCEVLIDGSTMIPRWAVEQWTRQINTPYGQLTESEKESDRREVRRYLPLIQAKLTAAEEKTKKLEQWCYDISVRITLEDKQKLIKILHPDKY